MDGGDGTSGVNLRGGERGSVSGSTRRRDARGTTLSEIASTQYHQHHAMPQDNNLTGIASYFVKKSSLHLSEKQQRDEVSKTPDMISTAWSSLHRQGTSEQALIHGVQRHPISDSTAAAHRLQQQQSLAEASDLPITFTVPCLPAFI